MNRHLAARLVLATTFVAAVMALNVVAPAQPAGEFRWIQAAVRQGDGAVFRGPCGEMGVIDTNRDRQQEILDELDRQGSRVLEWIAVTHYDSDHLGGIVDVATASGVSVETAYDRGGTRARRDSNPRPSD